MSAFTIGRWKPEGVQPVELWNLPIRGSALYRRLGSERVQELHSQGRDFQEINRELGGVMTEAVETIRPRLPPFEVVVVSGGLALRPDLLDAVVSRQGLDWVVSTEPEFGGARTGRLVIDLGQTRLKLSLGSARLRVARPLDLLPIHRAEGGSPSPEAAREQATRLLVIASSVVGAFVAANRTQPLEEIVLALPCALDDVGAPGLCTYAGLDGAWPARLIDRILASRPRTNAAAAKTLPVRVVNDAEWAGHLAREAGDGRAGLALTLGFGPGGAWFSGRSR